MSLPSTIFFQPPGRILSVDSRFEEVFGYRGAEVLGRNLEDVLILEESKSLYMTMLTRFQKYQVPDLADIFSYFLLKTKGGEKVHARAETKEVGSRSNALYALLLFTTPFSSCTLTFNTAGNIISWTNPALFGCTDKDLGNVNLFQLIPDLFPNQEGILLTTQQLDQLSSTHWHLSGKQMDGKLFPIDLRLSCFGLGKEEKLFNGTVYKLSDVVQAVFQLDSYGFILDCNKQMSYLFEYQKEELLGKTITCLLPEEYRRQSPKRKKFLWQGGYEDVLQVITKSGNTIHVNCSCLSLKKDNGGKDYVVRFSLFDIGKKIGPYIIGNIISQGSFGVVKEAIHSKSKKMVAVKIVNKEKQSKALCEREMTILRSLTHPNIVTLLDGYETSDKVFIVTEHIPGKLLKDLNLPMETEMAKHIFRQIVSAIQYCHKRDVFHRDINPSNILVKSDDQVKVIDFGLSTVAAQGSFQSTFCGSPAFAAPEIISGQKYSGKVADIWSLGILLHLMVTGVLPLQDITTAQDLQLEVSAPTLNEICLDLIKNMLQFDPAKRFTIDQVASHCWLK